MGLFPIVPLCSRIVVRKYRLNLDRLRRFLEDSTQCAGELCRAKGGGGDRKGRWAPVGSQRLGAGSSPCTAMF